MKDMPVFVLLFLQFFSGAEVPAGAPKYPALFFIRGFFLSLFDVSLWRGSGILPRKFAPEIFGGPEILAPGPEVPAQEIFG